MSSLGLMVLAQVRPDALPEEGGFFAIWKIIIMMVFLFLWAWPAGWICRDARSLQLNECLWGLLAVGAGLIAWCAWIFLPMYWLGFAFFFLLSFGSILSYAFYRDTVVEADKKILNPTNLMMAIRGEGEVKVSKEFKLEKKVMLVSIAGIEINPPTDSVRQQSYQLLQDVLFDGLWRRASDIYVQPAGQAYRVLFKIDGVMSEYTKLDRESSAGMIDYVKTLGQMDREEHRKPQKGKVLGQQVNVDRRFELDLETSGTRAGERAVIRVRAEEARFKIDDIGFTDDQLASLQSVLDVKNGLVIFGGLADAGISTTLYAFARSHDAFTQNILTVEAKKLMDLENVTQNIYQSGGEHSFARLLQSVSRREPDVMMVDPCADPETMKMIGAIVGVKRKKVFTTMRASTALSALSRTVNWLGDPALASKALLAVTYQRMVRKLCPACKEAYRPNPETLHKLNLSSKTNLTFYRPPTQPVVDRKGQPEICSACQGSGYLGRTGVFEVLIVGDELREAIGTADAKTVRTAARRSGFKYWQEVALEKVIAGVTSVQEVIRVSKEIKANTDKAQS